MKRKITSNKTKHVLVENELKKLQSFSSCLSIGQSYLNNDGAQLYLILRLLYYTLKGLDNTEKVVSWKSKGLSTGKLTTPPTTDNSCNISSQNVSKFTYLTFDKYISDEKCIKATSYIASINSLMWYNYSNYNIYKFTVNIFNIIASGNNIPSCEK